MRVCRLLVLLLLAALPLQAQEVPEEVKALESALTSEEAGYEAIHKFAEEHRNKIEENEDKIQELTAAGNSQEVQELLADTQRRYALLRAAYEMGLSHFDNNARLHNYYGEALYDGFGEQDAAVKEWFKSVALDDKYPNAYNNLALHFFHYGEYKQGIGYMDRALELDPKNPDFLFNTVQFYLMHGPQVAELRGWSKDKVYKQAMKLSKLAVKESPGDFELTQDYAVNFWKAEEFGVKADWKDAAKAWQEARGLAKRPDHIFFCVLNEARAWLQDGDYKRAEASAQEALKLMPESQAAQKLLERAREGKDGKKKE